MKKFLDFLKDAGFESLPVVPPEKTIYFAYKGGVAESFETYDEARKFNKLVEAVKVPNPERDAIIFERNSTWDKAQDKWLRALKEEYSDLVSPAIFDLCYSEAYAQGHPAGFDEIASCMRSKVEFAVSILNLAGK